MVYSRFTVLHVLFCSRSCTEGLICSSMTVWKVELQNRRFGSQTSCLSFLPLSRDHLSSHGNNRRDSIWALRRDERSAVSRIPPALGMGHATGSTPLLSVSACSAGGSGCRTRTTGLPRRVHWPVATRSRTPPSLGLLSIRLARGLAS